ncbi:MAG: hypothetical protein C4567_04450 [Deltaproteobacteria bacterium]|nr:MAG: hypothetical protein C4567_04450 [Deltaproteobacteria bacterium]
MSFLAVQLDLTDLFIISYIIPPFQIHPHIPKTLSLATINDTAFVSVVMFRSNGLRIPPLPPLSFPFRQINVRTYVKVPGLDEIGIYLFRAGITPVPMSLINPFLKMAFEEIKLDAKIEQDRQAQSKIYKVSGRWDGILNMEAREVRCISGNVLPFSNMEEIFNFLINVQTGFYGPEEDIRQLKVAHHESQAQIYQVDEVIFPFLSSLGFMTKEDTMRPFITFYIPETKMMVFLPSKKWLNNKVQT